MDLIPLWGKQPSLDEVRAQFGQWRHSRDKRKAIPEALWKAAASLYPVHLLHRISKALHFNPSKLKDYVQAPPPGLCIPTAPAFIEPGLAKPAAAHQGLVQMQHQNGASMTMQVTDSQDLIKLARLFLNRP